MARPSTSDPLDKFRWVMAIRQDGVETFLRLGFTSVETPKMDINTQKYPEGGSHLFPKQIVDSVEYTPITLSRGVTDTLDFQKWAQGCIELVRGVRADAQTNGQNLPASAYRRTVVIGHLNREGAIIRKYTLYNAFPISYKPASDFSSEGDDGLSIESITLAYESFTVESIAQDSNPTDTKDVFKRLVRDINIPI